MPPRQKFKCAACGERTPVDQIGQRVRQKSICLKCRRSGCRLALTTNEPFASKNRKWQVDLRQPAYTPPSIAH